MSVAAVIPPTLFPSVSLPLEQEILAHPPAMKCAHGLTSPFTTLAAPFDLKPASGIWPPTSPDCVSVEPSTIFSSGVCREVEDGTENVIVAESSQDHSI